MNNSAYLPLSRAVLEELGSLCLGQGIAHGELLEGEHRFSNHGVTDAAQVFIKLGRFGVPQQEYFEAELQASSLAFEAGINAPRALAPVLQLQDGRFLTIWAYEETSSTATHDAPTAIRSNEARQLLRGLKPIGVELHTLRDRLPQLLEAINARLGKIDHADAHAIREQSQLLMAKVLSSHDAKGDVLQHGDMHPKNLAWKPDGQLLVFDWESVMLAPLEWEHAEIVRDSAVWSPAAVAALKLGVSTERPLDMELAYDLAWIRTASAFALMVRVAGSGAGWASNDLAYRAQFLGVKNLPALLQAAREASK